MTGFDSKRKAASAKLNDDDDAQVYIAQYESALTIAYQSGYYDGKKAAQPAQEPVATIAVRWHKPVGKVAYVLEVNLPVGIHKLYPTQPQRPWVSLTDEEISDIAINNPPAVHEFARAVLAKSKDKNK